MLVECAKANIRQKRGVPLTPQTLPRWGEGAEFFWELRLFQSSTFRIVTGIFKGNSL